MKWSNRNIFHDCFDQVLVPEHSGETDETLNDSRGIVTNP